MPEKNGVWASGLNSTDSGTIQCVVFKYSNESFGSIGHRKFLDLKSNNQLLTWVLCYRVN